MFSSGSTYELLLSSRDIPKNSSEEFYEKVILINNVEINK